MAEISFKTALQITGDFQRNKDIVHIKRKNTPEWKGPDVMTVKDVKDKFDLKKGKSHRDKVILHERRLFRISLYLKIRKGQRRVRRCMIRDCFSCACS